MPTNENKRSVGADEGSVVFSAMFTLRNIKNESDLDLQDQDHTKI